MSSPIYFLVLGLLRTTIKHKWGLGQHRSFESGSHIMMTSKQLYKKIGKHMSNKIRLHVGDGFQFVQCGGFVDIMSIGRKQTSEKCVWVVGKKEHGCNVSFEVQSH
jgi:hypothetical protein